MPQKIKSTQILTLPADNISHTTRVSNKKTKLVYGWGYITSNGSAGPTQVYDLTPYGFSSAPTVIATVAGYKVAGPVPTSVSDVTGFGGEIVRGGQQTTATSTTIYITNAAGTAISSGVHLVYNIIIIGEVA